MSFAPGDVVVCVNARPGLGLNPHPTGENVMLGWLKEGRAYTVDRPHLETGRFPMPSTVWVVGQPEGLGGYNERRFRKINKADEEFTHQIRSLAPKELA